MDSRSAIVTARVTPTERLLADVAAEIGGVSRSAFLRRAAVREVDRVLERAREERLESEPEAPPEGAEA